jgi:transcriptional regulator with XRE-family HTH domain
MNFGNIKNPYFTDEEIIKSFHKTAPVAKEIDMQIFGQRLKYARLKACLTQQELAQLLSDDDKDCTVKSNDNNTKNSRKGKISKTTISNWETAKRQDYNPGIKTIYQIAYLLKVSIDWLCGFSEFPSVASITEHVKKEIYITLLLDIMKTATYTQKYKKNYYKIPRRGPVFELKEKLEALDYQDALYTISPDSYKAEKEILWNEVLDMDIETIKSLTFDDKEYNKYSAKKSRERQVEEELITDDDLPFS